MSTTQLVYLLVVFLAVFGVALAILLQIGARPILKRLDGVMADHPDLPQQAAPAWIQRVVQLSGPLAKLALPQEGWENSNLRIRFMNAGYRYPAAPVVFFAAKTLLALALLGLLAALFWHFRRDGKQVDCGAFLDSRYRCTGVFLAERLVELAYQEPEAGNFRELPRCPGSHDGVRGSGIGAGCRSYQGGRVNAAKKHHSGG